MVKEGHQIYYSAYDVSGALRLGNKRRAVNEIVIHEAGSYSNLIEWGNEKVLFLSDDYVIPLSFRADWDITKRFIKWMLEVVQVSKKMEDEAGSGASHYDIRNYYATTQIGKMYGISAKHLNEILSREEIQYKVNDQWVLYSKYQDMNLTKTVRINKYRDDLFQNDEFIFHTYWTEKGVEFVGNILKGLGYELQGEQVSLF